MTAWKRWQDYATMVFIVAAATREPRRSLIVNAPGLVAVITFIAAVVLAFEGALGVAWTAGILAILTLAVGATLRMGRTPEMKSV